MVYVVLRKCTQQLACFSPFNHHPADILVLSLSPGSYHETVTFFHFVAILYSFTLKKQKIIMNTFLKGTWCSF
ncbi:hypothetical protein BKA70DRAFT_1566785 [Coprinopsis sp. MPI-PUGE-AT-0042]|nr:hypothetical protein BKA70DRAFT_1566785 [Coprinopsis sp. MPI-PUGE-AT-0042]